MMPPGNERRGTEAASFSSISRLAVLVGDLAGFCGLAGAMPILGFSVLLEKLEAYQTFGGGDDGLLIGARCPAEYALCLFVGGALFLAELGRDQLDRGSRNAARRTSQLGSSRVGTRFASTHAVLEPWRYRASRRNRPQWRGSVPPLRRDGSWRGGGGRRRRGRRRVRS